MKSSFFAWGELFAWSRSDSQGRSLRGTAPGGAFDKVVLYKVGRKYWNSQSCKRASVGGGSGPLIPRSSGFNGGIVFDCHSLRSEFCCWEYALRRSLLLVVGQLSVPCLSRLCLV